MADTNQKPTRTLSTATIGARVAKEREQLQQIEAERRRHAEESRKAVEESKKRIAALEAHGRQASREQDLREKRRATFLLGELVMSAIRTEGLTEFKMFAEALNSLKLEDLELVARVVERNPAPSRPPPRSASEMAS